MDFAVRVAGLFAAAQLPRKFSAVAAAVIGSFIRAANFIFGGLESSTFEVTNLCSRKVNGF